MAKFEEIFKHSVLSTLATNVVSSIGFPASTTPASVVVESILLSKKDLESAVLSNSDPNSWQKLQRILIHDVFLGGPRITRFQSRHGCIHQTPVRLHRKKAHIESFTHSTRCTEELPQFGKVKQSKSRKILNLRQSGHKCMCILKNPFIKRKTSSKYIIPNSSHTK